MLTHLEILTRVRQAKTRQPAGPKAEDLGLPVSNLGAPDEYQPGQKCVDPVTGDTCEVIAYGRTHSINPSPQGGGA